MENKNIVFIPNINLDNGRNNPYHYSISSWEKWAEQYDDIDIIEWTDPVMDPSIFKITLQRYWVHDILEYNDIKYDQVLMVDADTIIHPECPNFFNETHNKMGITLSNGCYEWVTRSIKQWGDSLFPNDPKVKTWKYFNGGFQITSKTHIPFYKKVQEYYTLNIDKINIDVEYMSEAYNLQDLFRKNLLHIPGHSWFPDELLYLQAGWVYHFNAIPPNNRHVEYWMERTYNELYK